MIRISPPTIYLTKRKKPLTLRVLRASYVGFMKSSNQDQIASNMQSDPTSTLGSPVQRTFAQNYSKAVMSCPVFLTEIALKAFLFISYLNPVRHINRKEENAGIQLPLTKFSISIFSFPIIFSTLIGFKNHHFTSI